MDGMTRLREFAATLEPELRDIAGQIEGEARPGGDVSVSAYDLLPEGEREILRDWPRFEDGEPVRVGDRVLDDDGNPAEVTFLSFNGRGVDIGLHDGCCDYNEDYLPGERVKRPAPKVFDADGKECDVGDDVWWTCNKTGNFRIIRIDEFGRCAIRDDDGDEPCGITVPSTELTHRCPVLDADGIEIRVGDRVWDEAGEEWRVRCVDCAFMPGHVQVCNSDRMCYMEPALLTHRLPDSWEEIKRDLAFSPTSYCLACGIETGKEQDEERAAAEMARDLVRRARELAERGER